MWNAFKSDLLDFVNTISDDTSKTINKVLGDENQDSEEKEQDENIKAIQDTTRSFNTYANDIEESHRKDYQRFLKNFSLSVYASEIHAILDEEVDVARFYTELVPSMITPEIFWSRYFYKIMLIDRNALSLDEEDEELPWENELVDEKEVSVNNEQQVFHQSDDVIPLLRKENEILKSQINMLVNRISELEKVLAEKDGFIVDLKKEKSDNTIDSSNIHAQSCSSNSFIEVATANVQASNSIELLTSLEDDEQDDWS